MGERYLTGFVIDAACFKYIELSINGQNSLFLPTFCQDWTQGVDAEYIKSKVMQYTPNKSENMSKLHWIMMPLVVYKNRNQRNFSNLPLFSLRGPLRPKAHFHYKNG